MLGGIELIGRALPIVLCICLGTAACDSRGERRASTPRSQAVVANAASPPIATSAASRSATRITQSNPSTAIVDINRSVPQQLGPNSPPPTTFENSCAPAPYVFQSIAGYEAVRVKDCRNDQLLYLPSSAQALIGIYTEECARRCGGG